MPNLIKIYEQEGSPVDESEQEWCAVIDTDCARTVCGYALDAFRTLEFKEKTVKRGGITCPICIDLIKQHKAIKL